MRHSIVMHILFMVDMFVCLSVRHKPVPLCNK